MFTNKIVSKVKDQECLVKIPLQITTIKECLFTNKNLISGEVIKESDLLLSDSATANTAWSLICLSGIS